MSTEHCPYKLHIQFMMAEEESYCEFKYEKWNLNSHITSVAHINFMINDGNYILQTSFESSYRYTPNLFLLSLLCKSGARWFAK